jgi:hypothetical protein
MAASGHNHPTAADQPGQLPLTSTEHRHAAVLTHTAWAGWGYEAENPDDE